MSKEMPQMNEEEMQKYINSPRFVEDLAGNLFAGIHNICSNGSIMERVGKAALDYIADYPLYASTSNITYAEAITIALMAGKSFQELLDEAGLVSGKDYEVFHTLKSN